MRINFFFSFVTQNFNLVHSVVMLIIKAKKGALYHNKGLFIKYMGDLFTTCFFQKTETYCNQVFDIHNKQSVVIRNLKFMEVDLWKIFCIIMKS